MEAARTLQRRMRARVLYRKRRDRKIPVEWLGREFHWLNRNEIHGGVERLPMRIEGYDPDRATVLLRCLWPTAELATVIWNTDEFWSLANSGLIERA